MVRAVLFDLDGVLIDSSEIWFQVMDATARLLGVPPISRDRYLTTFGQGVEDDVDAFYPGHAAATVAAYYEEQFQDHIDRLRPMPGARATVRALREQGRGVCVVTNTSSELARSLLRRASIEPDALVGSTDVARAKPAPDMIFRACETLGVRPADCLFVGDSRFDALAAAAAGVRFVGFGRDGDRRVDSHEDLLALDLLLPVGNTGRDI